MGDGGEGEGGQGRKYHAGQPWQPGTRKPVNRPEALLTGRRREATLPAQEVTPQLFPCRQLLPHLRHSHRPSRATTQAEEWSGQTDAWTDPMQGWGGLWRDPDEHQDVSVGVVGRAFLGAEAMLGSHRGRCSGQEP